MTPSGPEQTTPLYEFHRRLGARFVPFAGFQMPVQYTSILDEHRAVRERAGLFDVSHMGQIHLRGPGAVADAERLVSCPVESLRPGRVRYGLLCNERGGVVDDVTVYRVGPEAIFFCVNAANIDKDRRWIESQVSGECAVEDRSATTALLALQGPSCAAILGACCDLDLGALRRFRFAEGRVAGAPCTISRTGYTGSDGFELYLGGSDAVTVFGTLLDAGADAGLVAAGLGARDTLRLEAALPLYGHELDDDTSPFEAGLDRFVKADGFIGADALKERPIRKRLAGFVVEGRGIVRADHELWDGDEAGGPRDLRRTVADARKIDRPRLRSAGEGRRRHPPGCDGARPPVCRCAWSRRRFSTAGTRGERWRATSFRGSCSTPTTTNGCAPRPTVW